MIDGVGGQSISAFGDRGGLGRELLFEIRVPQAEVEEIALMAKKLGHGSEGFIIPMEDFRAEGFQVICKQSELVFIRFHGEGLLGTEHHEGGEDAFSWDEGSHEELIAIERHVVADAFGR